MAYGDQDFKKFNDNIKKCELKDFETILMKIFEQSNSKGGDRTSIEKFGFIQGLALFSNALCRLVDEDLACIQEQTKEQIKQMKKQMKKQTKKQMEKQMEKMKRNSLEVLSNYEKNEKYFESKIKEYFEILCNMFDKYKNYIYGVYITNNQLIKFVKKNEKEIYNDLKNMIHKLDDKELLSDDFFAPLKEKGSLFELNKELCCAQLGTDSRASAYSKNCHILGLDDNKCGAELVEKFHSYFIELSKIIKEIKLSDWDSKPSKNAELWKCFYNNIELIKNDCINKEVQNKNFLLLCKNNVYPSHSKLCETLKLLKITPL